MASSTCMQDSSDGGGASREGGGFCSLQYRLCCSPVAARVHAGLEKWLAVPAISFHSPLKLLTC